MTIQRLDVRSTDGTILPVRRSGHGRPLVLVHGAMGSHEIWSAVLPFLEPRFTLLAMDRRSTLGDPASRYTLEREFEDVAAVVEAAGDNVDVVGHSLGAVCALGASLLTGNVRRLVLYEPPLVRAEDAFLPAELERLYAAGDLAGVIETFLREGPRVPPEVIERVKQAPGWEERARYLPREMAAFYGWRPEEAGFHAIQAPALLLIGELTPRGHVQRGYEAMLGSTLPHLEVREIPGQGHGAIVQAPELFAGMVVEFLEAG